MYKKDSIVGIRPFTRQRDGEEVVIGSPETGVFLALPPDAVDLLDQLAAGKTVGEVAELHRDATGETPDLEDFLSVLESKGLIEPEFAGPGSGDKLRGDKLPPRIREPKFHFSGFPQSLARLLFSYPVLVCEAMLTVLAIALILRHHSLMPVPMDLVFSNHRALGLTILAVVAYGGIFLHEMAHLIAARAIGVNARFGISHRLWYLVVETDLTGLWSMPRRQRYLPMLAGMLFDTVFTALLVVLIFAGQQRLLSLTPWAESLLRATAFTNLMRILWEFFLFTRTDIYYVAATFLNCKNMLTDTRVFLRNQMTRFSSSARMVDQSGIPAIERRAVQTYAIFYVAGIVWAFSSLFWVTIPFCASYGANLVRAFRIGYSANPSDFLDAVLASCYFLIPTGAGFVLWGRTLIRSKGIL